MSIPENWQPTYNEAQTRRLLKAYENRGHNLSEDKQELLEQHAEAYGIPFFPGDFSLMDAIYQAGAGFVEGFTTLNVADHPDNEYEQVARNLGHLAGFAPGLMAAPLKAIGGARALAASQAVSKIKSFPLLISETATDYAKQAIKSAGKGFVGRSQAVQTAKNFALGQTARGMIGHAAEGAFNLGVASSVSAWQGGVDAMIEGFKGGAMAGGIFRAIGNLTPGTSTHEKMTKALAGSLFMGIPSSLRGDTTPEQVYEYVAGAYFGGNEVSWSRAKAMKFIPKIREKGLKEPEWAMKSGLDPEFHPEYEALPEPVKPLVKEMATKQFGPPDEVRGNFIAGEIVKQLGLSERVTEDDLIAAGFKETGEYVDGQKQFKLSKDLVKEKFKIMLSSGGAKGADTAFAEWADTRGIPTVHYTFGKHSSTIKAPGLRRQLTVSELDEADVHRRKANQSIGKHVPKDKYNEDLQRRNWFQVKWSDSVYAVGEFEPYLNKDNTPIQRKTPDGNVIKLKKHGLIKGGTGLTAQMAIDNGKPVYFFDQVSRKWYEWSNDAQKFKILPGLPPRPTNRFAGIGTRSINKYGKQAIQELFETYYKPGEPATTQLEKATISDSQQKRLNEIESTLESMRGEYNELKDQITINKQKGQDVASYENAMEKLSMRSEELVEEANKINNARLKVGALPSVYLNKEAVEGEIAGATELDMESPTDIRLGKKSWQFVNKHLEGLTAGAITPGEKKIRLAEIGELAEQTLVEKNDLGEFKYLTGTTKNNSELWAKDLEVKLKKYDDTFTLKEEAKREMRQWMTTYNLGRQVTHLRSDGNKIMMMPNNENPVSFAGNRKQQKEPMKALEEAFYNNGGNAEEAAYMVLDHVTVTGKNGRNDLSISQYRDHLVRENGFNAEKGKKAYDSFIANSIRDMAKKDYYTFGGSGDKDRIHFVKFHPQTEGIKLDSILKNKEVNKVHKNFKNDLEAARREFRMSYGMTEAEAKPLFERMYKSNLAYDLHMNGMQVNDANITKLLTHPGFIKNSAAYNKRLQIWMTNAWSGDASFIQKQGVKLNDKGGYNYIITNDLSEAASKLSKKEQSEIKRLNTELPEHVDGAIIVRDDVINAINADFGIPFSGQNKSFIVAPHGERGALLGKYMLHSAGPKMTEMMKKSDNMHMIMQETAVKQRGTREKTDYSVKNNKLVIKNPEFVYGDVQPKHLRGNFSVYGSSHAIENQRIPKQMLQNLLSTSWDPVSQEVINDTFSEIVQKRFYGNDAVNAKVDAYLEMAKSGKTDIASENYIIKNIDKIGVDRLLKAMKSEFTPELNEAIYNKILKLEKESAIEDWIANKENEGDLSTYMEEINEFNSLSDRIIRNAQTWANTQRQEGIDANITSVYMHKFMRDFRVKAVQNFIISSVTKPKRNNSAAAFMRPYDKAMQSNLDGVNPLLESSNKKGINYNDEVFMLDNEFKKLRIGIKYKGKVQHKGLGEWWELLPNTKGKDRKTIEDALEAATVRVPMDSMSGVQVMKFGGFTGRQGYGILLHSRAMRAEGGADLDGDKSFVFFGGHNGMKNSWKDAYKKNKKEFYTKDKKGVERVGDNKEDINPFTGKQYREELVEEFSDTRKNQFNSKAFQYAPNERIRISEAAVNGRNQLGPAVVNKQVMASAYSAIQASGGNDVLEFRAKDHKKRKTKTGKDIWNDYVVSIKTRTDSNSKKVQRGMGRAQLGLASDPLDELGLKSKNEWFKKMWNAHFEITGVGIRNPYTGKIQKINKKDWADTITSEKLSASKLKGGVLSALTNINRAYWGRNWAEGRKFSMAEINELGSEINVLPEKGLETSFLSKTGQLLEGTDWSDSMFGKINMKNLDTVYKAHIERVEQNPHLKGLLGRSSMAVKKNEYIANTHQFKLFTSLGLRNTANDPVEFRKAIKGTAYEKIVKDNPKEFFGTMVGGELQGAYEARLKRIQLLEKLKNQSEDFLVNDITDIATTTEVSKIIDTMLKTGDKGGNFEGRNLNEVVELIHRKVESLKRTSYLMARDRKRLASFDQPLKFDNPKEAKTWELIKESVLRDQGKKHPEDKVRRTGEDLSAEKDQITIDAEISKFKTNLSPNGIRLFDQLMLGSLNRGNVNKIQEFMDSVKKWDPVTLDVVQSFRREAARTSMSRLGFNSTAISDKSIQDHIGAFASNFNETLRPITRNQIDTATERFNKATENIAEPEIDSRLTEMFLPSGLEGIKQGKLAPESQALANEIVQMLKTYNNNVGKNIAEIVRSTDVIGKDLNAMTKEDFIVLRNWLHEMKRGNFIQRMFHKDGPVKLNKRHWALFPLSVNRELMRDDLVLMREKGFFTDRYGTVQEGTISRPTHYVDIIQNWIGKMTDSAVNISDRYIKQFNDSMLFHSGLQETGGLWEIAIRTRENKTVERNRIKASDMSPEAKEVALKELGTRLGEAHTKHDWKSIKSKKFTVTVDGKRQELTGQEIVDRIDLELTRTFNDLRGFIVGEKDALKEYKLPTPRRHQEYDYRKFIRHLEEHITGRSNRWKKEGITDIPSFFGIDGLRRIARSMQVDMLPKEEMKKQFMEEPFISTGDLGEAYFPHMFFDPAVAKKTLKKAVYKVMESSKTKEEKEIELKKLYFKNKATGGDWHFEDVEKWDILDSVLSDIASKKKVSSQKIKWFSSNERTGSMKSRDVHMSGWSIEPTVVETYIRTLSNTYHRQLSQMFSRIKIDDMGSQMFKKWGKTQTNAWQNFMRLYVQDAIGNPTIIPDRMYNDPNMKIKGTPYGWWSDSKVKEKINKVGKFLGLGDKKLPEDLRGVDYDTVRAWSNLEAQYEMASLLAHPKSMVANIFGGVSHTISSAGFGNFVKARDYGFLSKINPEWTNKQAINNFVVSQGVLPEFLVYELGQQKAFQNSNGKAFLTELTGKLTRNPEMTEKTFREIASSYGIKDRIVNKAAKFMTVPERALRRDAFMAHYIQAWERFGGAIKEYDHPFLVQLAKKGVKATQFLYNAPFRPAFARSSLGKFMSRFQLWAWNSVRFRNDVARQARIYGYQPGTAAMSRFQRMMQIDMATFALANVFAYSIFESNLPQPYGWIQDYSDWLFGDEEARDRAFYGAWPKEVAPLQMVTPPGLRLTGPVLQAMLNDDWSRIAQYHVYAMFPFGRIARDINPYAKGNLIENPIRAFEKLGGIPMMQLQRNVTAWKDKEDPETGEIIKGKKLEKPTIGY